MAEKNLVTTDCYLTLAPQIDYRGVVSGIRVAKVTQVKPKKPTGAPFIHLRIHLPTSIFQAIEAVLDVPPKDIQIIQVESVNANEANDEPKS